MISLEELNRRATEIAKWLSPDQIVNNIVNYLASSDKFLEEEIKRRFNFYKADPRYENLRF